jgi:hypothetical protein
MKMSAARKRLALICVAALVTVIVCNYPCTYRVGVNGKVSTKKIPLYAKACGFLYRDWAYRDVVSSVIGPGRKNDTEKALAILKWTNDNVMSRVPDGVKVVDDHPLNIIIRQYGAGDQVEDVFTILCSYAGMPAGMVRCYNAARNASRNLSVVLVDGRWLIFNAGKGKYFLNKAGRIGSIEDYKNGQIELSAQDEAVYKEYLDDLKTLDPDSFTRPDEQMPMRRIPAEIRKAIYRFRGK